MPLISAIMPTYNRCPMLRNRLAELYAQTCQDWELIIVNDCSTDSTKGFLDALDDPRIKVIHLEKNSGCVTIPRNIGITKATGKFICPTDDDVENKPNKLKVLSDTLITYPKAILSYGDRETERNGRIETIVLPNWNPFAGSGIDNGQIMYRNIYQSFPLLFCRRACDWELAKQLRTKGPFIRVPEIVSKYIWHGANRSLDPSTKTRPMDINYYNNYFNGYKQLIV